MPKDRRVDRSRASPYACSSKNSDLDSQKSSLSPVGNEREWQDARCPICMEHPHNAVLLLCSSRDKGCQPYMCDTSHRHSNCFDQFCKSAVGALQGEGYASGDVFRRGSWGQALSGATSSHVQQQPELACPLCRGHVEGWVVVKAACNFMNSKTRTCALETCNFSGNYAELRKHARDEHPSERPSEVDPMRQSNWTRLERQRDIEDAFSAYQAPSDDSSSDDFLTELPIDGGLSDLLEGFSEDEEELDEDINMSLDFEFELSFSFLSEFPSVPWAWDGSPSYAGGRSTYRSESGARSQNRRSRRSASGSDIHEQRPRASRSTSLSSRRTPSSFREERWNG